MCFYFDWFLSHTFLCGFGERWFPWQQVGLYLRKWVLGIEWAGPVPAVRGVPPTLMLSSDTCAWCLAGRSLFWCCCFYFIFIVYFFTVYQYKKGNKKEVLFASLLIPQDGRARRLLPLLDVQSCQHSILPDLDSSVTVNIN